MKHYTTKAEVNAIRTEKLEKAKTLKYKSIPHKGQSTADGGDAGEIDVKRLLRCDGSLTFVSDKIGYDFYKTIDGRRAYFEIKTCLTQYADFPLDEFTFEIIGDACFAWATEADYMIYSLWYDPRMSDDEKKNTFHVIPVSDFYAYITTTKGVLKKPNDRRLYDENGALIGKGNGVVIQQQSYKNSMKTPRGMGYRFNEFVNGYPTLAEFFNV